MFISYDRGLILRWYDRCFVSDNLPAGKSVHSYMKGLVLKIFKQHCKSWLVLFSFMILVSQGAINFQFIRFWAECMGSMSGVGTTLRLFWRHPDPATSKHQKALWMAAMGSVVLLLYSIGTTILVCIRPSLWVQLTTVCVLASSAPRSLTCCIAPSRHD